jgi:hypothetical protein
MISINQRIKKCDMPIEDFYDRNKIFESLHTYDMSKCVSMCMCLADQMLNKLDARAREPEPVLVNKRICLH